MAASTSKKVGIIFSLKFEMMLSMIWHPK